MEVELPISWEETAVVMVPLPAQSHLNQLVQLASLISSYDSLQVHFIGSETHNRQAKLRSTIGNLSQTAVQFHDLPTPPISAPDPDPHALDKTPMHFGPATQAYASLRQGVTSFVRALTTKTNKRVVLIYDRLMSEPVRDAVKISNVESYGFNCLSAFNLFYTLWDAKGGKPFEQVGDGRLQGIPSVNEFMPRQVIQFMLSNDLPERRGYIHNTSRVIDGAFLDLMSREELDGQKKLQWAVTPTILFPVKNERRSKHGCLEWLDKQEPRSVIYVSFGTSVSISEDEAREMAFGLEQSKHKFLWVLRDSDRSDIFVKEARKIALPQGFEERVGQDGMVVRDWAPQRDILAHESIGGFVTHCGWNSCYESLSFGVPIAAWPMHSDQPLNAIFMTRLLKVGFMVREWDQRGEPVRASAIKSIVERLIASQEGNDIRKKAHDISVAIQSSTEEARRELDAFIAHITRDNCDCS